eukprot:jgi/Picre1/29933/NNA_005311.t1
MSYRTQVDCIDAYCVWKFRAWSSLLETCIGQKKNSKEQQKKRQQAPVASENSKYKLVAECMVQWHAIDIGVC